MNKSFRVARCLLLFAVVVGCGGGGGGDSEPFFAGVYDVNYVKVIDNCNSGLPSMLTHVHTVNQDGRRIVLDSGSINATGFVNQSDDGFEVSREDNENGCRVVSAAVYLPATGGADYDAGFAVISRCGSAECQVAYGGEAFKR